MDELLRNFVGHLKMNFSMELAEQINDYLSTKCLTNIDDYDILEHDVKQIISGYIKKCNFLNLSQNLYNGYIHNDDKALISAIKLFTSVYGNFQQIRLRCLLYRWRILSITGLDSNISQRNGNFKKVRSESLDITRVRAKNQVDNKKTTKKNKNFNSLNKTNHMIERDQPNVFNKLYINSYRKNDERLLNEEIKKLSELEECTFRPNISKIN